LVGRGNAKKKNPGTSLALEAAQSFFLIREASGSKSPGKTGERLEKKRID